MDEKLPPLFFPENQDIVLKKSRICLNYRTLLGVIFVAKVNDLLEIQRILLLHIIEPTIKQLLLK